MFFFSCLNCGVILFFILGRFICVLCVVRFFEIYICFEFMSVCILERGFFFVFSVVVFICWLLSCGVILNFIWRISFIVVLFVVWVIFFCRVLGGISLVIGLRCFVVYFLCFLLFLSLLWCFCRLNYSCWIYIERRKFFLLGMLLRLLF